MKSTQRLDPEPLAIIAVVVGSIGAGISAVSFWMTHLKRLPYRTRQKLLKELDDLSAEVKYLEADVQDIESLLSGAKFMDGPTLRLGNGAMLTAEQFRRYQRLAERVFTRIKKLHSLALKVQGLAFELPYTDKLTQNNATGSAIERAEHLLQSRDYSVHRAFEELRALARDLEVMIQQLNHDLGREQT